MAVSTQAAGMGLVGWRLRVGAASQGTEVAVALQAIGSDGLSCLCLSFPIPTAI